MTDRSPGWRLLMGDMAFNLIAMLTLVIAILLVFFNPPTEAEDTRAPGDLRFWCEWPDEINADIDMWVRAPRGTPVGYSNKGNEWLNLVRDDLGFYRDISGNNEELTVSRGFVPGEYQVNLHYYNWHGGGRVQPVPVKCWAEQSDGQETKIITLKTETMMLRPGQEKTVFRFTLDNDRQLVDGSVSDHFTPLRAGSTTYRGPFQ